MNIQFEVRDKVNGQMTITVGQGDYAGEVEKELKNYRRKANVPGFRPGQVPMGMLRKMYGTSVKLDVVNKLVSDELYKYVKDNNIQMLGHALPSEAQQPQDLASDTDHTFVFDIAVAPEFELNLSEKDKVNYYKIKVDDALIDRQVEMFASRMGQYVKAEEYAEGDMLKGDLTELDGTGAKEGGLAVADAIIFPMYIKDEAQKKLYAGAKLGDKITVNPRKMYGDTELAALLKTDKDEALQHTGDFSFEVKEISRYEKHAVDQALFDNVYGTGSCADEKAFRERIAEGLKVQLQSDSDYKFLTDVRAYAEKKTGKLAFPEALLKRIMLEGSDDKDEAKIDKNFDASLHQLTWHLIKEKLVAAYEIKVSDDDVKAAAVEAARVQFAQYGMNNVPEEYLENYAGEMMKKRESLDGLVDRAVDVKLTAALKTAITLKEKEVSLDEFNKLAEEK
ncbi:MAG: trigger factor [Prevotella sp.]|nr:trigger factor [Prevotella sp.]